MRSLRLALMGSLLGSMLVLAGCADPPPQARTFWAISGLATCTRDRPVMFAGFELELDFMPTAGNMGEAARIQPRFATVDPSMDQEPLALNFQVPAGTYNVQAVFRGVPVCSGGRAGPSQVLGRSTANGAVAPGAGEGTRTPLMFTCQQLTGTVCP